MKPTQFIKDHGLERAREVVKGEPDRTASHYVADTDTYFSEEFLTYFDHSLNDWETADLNSIDELETIYELVIDLRILKRLVESVDLVKAYGGIVMAKRQLDLFLRVNLEQGTMLSNTVSRLKDAVTDYESIYGEGNEQ
ncbi:hypothetical protein ACS125_18640 [Acinetobacter sp. PFS20]|uniref:hypothetical protein n=1 Tax=Acinetobacter sp. PFS20 TaxID=3458434 RepID=UPI003FD33EE8